MYIDKGTIEWYYYLYSGVFKSPLQILQVSSLAHKELITCQSILRKKLKKNSSGMQKRRETTAQTAASKTGETGEYKESQHCKAENIAESTLG